MGIFDEGCMGMYNAIIPDELLHPTGVYKERLSQSALYAEMQTVTDAEARAVYQWLRDKGMTFQLGPDEATDLTEAQVLGQCKMYIAALRIADEFGCATIGIQYQQGLKDLAPASDLVEGLLNNVERPPVKHEDDGQRALRRRGPAALQRSGRMRRPGRSGHEPPVEADWAMRPRPPCTICAGAVNTQARAWTNTSGSSRSPAPCRPRISSAATKAPPASASRRCTSACGGGTVKGISKPGHIVWSRVFVEDGALKFDTGLAEVVALPQAETQDRWDLTTPQWPIMHAVLKGITRDQMMARHKANHIQVAYAPDAETARQALYAKAAAMHALGLDVNLCGEV